MSTKVNEITFRRVSRAYECEIVLSDGWSHTSAPQASKDAALVNAIEHLIEFYNGVRKEGK